MHMPQRDSDEPVYMISIAARLCEMHPQTLRLYERMGLIKPQRIGSKNRVYSDSDIERLRQIQRLTHELGVNLAGVEVIFGLLEQMEEMRKRMENDMEIMRKRLEARIKELESAS
jgi:MerR family transcriptional regulator, heat shock protein HspR